MAIDANAPRSRRTILAAALGGAGALFAHALGRATPIAAADGDPVNAGETTTAATVTTLTSDADGFVGNSDQGTGVTGHSDGPGIGNPDPENPVASYSTGVIGTAGATTDIAQITDATGVYGFANDSAIAAGVWGDSLDGTGVVGTGYYGVYGGGFYGTYGQGQVGVAGDVFSDETGVFGFSGDDVIPEAPAGAGVVGQAGPNGKYGVVARATAVATQYALYVDGKVHFSRSGRVSIGSTSTSRKITMAGVTSASYVIATLQTSVSGCYVRAVVPTTGAFTIYLSKAPGKTVYVGYVVVH